MSSELHTLTQAEITERELSPQQLWIIKQGSDIRGPYELENLKAYIQDNESLFEEALASRMSPLDWNPLFSYPQFQRRSPQIIAETSISDGPFWIYQQGVKTGPFEKFSILKSLEMNSLIVTDKISVDNGKNWINIYEIPEFDRRELGSLDLPIAPEQTLAQLYGRAEEMAEDEQLLESESTSEVLASSAHRGLYKNKVLQFKTENYSLPKNTSSFWSSLTLPDWFMPSAVALGVMIVGGVMYALIPAQNDETLSVASITEQSRPLGEKRMANPSAQLGRKRTPASVREIPLPRKQPSLRDNIPTTIQTHHVDRYPSNDSYADPDYGYHEEPYTDPHDNPFEHDGAITHEAAPAASLVPPRKRARPRQPSSVSEVMGYEENLMDEASDF